MKCKKCNEKMERQHGNVYKCYFCGSFGIDINHVHDEMEESMKSYKIIRFYKDADVENKIVDSGLTLEDAQSHCRDDSTMEEGVFFDGYEEE